MGSMRTVRDRGKTRRLVASWLDVLALVTVAAWLAASKYQHGDVWASLALLAVAGLFLTASRMRYWAWAHELLHMAYLSTLLDREADAQQVAPDPPRDAEARCTWGGDVDRAMDHLGDSLERLVAAERQGRSILQDQTELICRWLPDGTLTYVNEAYCRYFQRSREDLVGQTFTPLIPEEYAHVMSDALDNFSPQSPVARSVHPVVLDTGLWRWQEWIDRAVFGPDGQLAEVQSVGRDITDQHDAEVVVRIQRDLALKLLGVSDVGQVYELLLDAAMAMPGVECGGVYAFDGQNRELDLVSSCGLAPEFVQHVQHYASDSPNVAMVCAGQVTAMANVREELAQALTQTEAKAPPGNIICIPIMDEAVPLGALNVGTYHSAWVPEISSQALEAVAASAGSAVVRIRNTDQMRQNRANLQTLFDNVNDLITVGDTMGRVIEANAAVERTLGYSRREVLGMSIGDLHPPQHRAEAAEVIAAMLRGETNTCILPLQSRDGMPIPTETVVTLGTWDDQPAVFGISRDVSDRERARHAVAESTLNRRLAVELARVSEGLACAQEEERRRLAVELHDEIGQVLTGLQLLLEGRGSLSRDHYDARVDRAREAISELLRRVRNMSLDLHPTALEDIGLFAALDLQIARLAAQTGLRVEAELDGPEQDLPTEVRLAAFRIIQEALTNVVRHAGVGKARVRVQVSQSRAALEVWDEGVGFDPETTSAHTLGHAGMRVRARAHQGSLRVLSKPGVGTRIEADLYYETHPTDGR